MPTRVCANANIMDGILSTLRMISVFYFISFIFDVIDTMRLIGVNYAQYNYKNKGNRSHPPLVPTLRRGNHIFAKAALIRGYRVQRSMFPRRSVGTRSGGE